MSPGRALGTSDSCGVLGVGRKPLGQPMLKKKGITFHLLKAGPSENVLPCLGGTSMVPCPGGPARRRGL